MPADLATAEKGSRAARAVAKPPRDEIAHLRAQIRQMRAFVDEVREMVGIIREEIALDRRLDGLEARIDALLPPHTKTRLSVIQGGDGDAS